MSFLAGRLAATEGAYFLQESKQAVGRLVQKTTPKSKQLPSPSSSSPLIENVRQSDVLPEVLKHAIPSKILQPTPSDPSGSSFSSSKWALQSHSADNISSASSDALYPLRAYVSLPQVTFGPKRWQLPESRNSVSASTANELRRDKHMPVDPEKLKAATAGLAQIAKAFAVATAIVFGGATLTIAVAASKLEVHNTDDLKRKGKDLVQPRFNMVKEQLIPFKIWVEEASKKWHFERGETIKEKPFIKELSKHLGAKTPN